MILALLLLAVWVWAIVDAALAREFRMGPRWMWILLLALLFVPGVVLYLALGRQYRPAGGDHPSRPPPAHPPRRSIPRGPDDDPDFLRSI